MTVASITAETLVARLASITAELTSPGVVAFDADGTLWTGDVADDVFLHATDEGLLRPSARPALAALAGRHGVTYPTDAPSSHIARALFSAYHEGRLPEPDTYAMMAWCYAGFTRAELLELARSVLIRAGLPTRINQRVVPILEWTRAHGLGTWVVSASPLPILEVGIQMLGLSPDTLIATEPAMDGAWIQGHLRAPVPYAEAKVAALRARTGDAELVAAFGDSRFDLAMLRAATFGVAVNPKPELLDALADRPGIVVLC